MKKINKLIKSRTFLIVLSCIASIALWVYVTSFENTTQQVTLSIPVEFDGVGDKLPDRNLVMTDQDLKTVRLTLEVKRSLVGKLTEETVAVHVDLSDIRSSGVYEKVYTIGYEGVEEQEVTVVRMEPETVTVNIDDLKTVPIPVFGEIDMGCFAEGYEAENVSCSPASIQLTGPQALVSQVSYAEAVIVRENLSKSVSGSIAFVLKDATGETVEEQGLATNVEEVDYSIVVVKRGTVELGVQLIAGGGAAELDADVTIEPDTVTVIGDAAVVDGLSQIQLTEIDLGSFAEGYTGTYTIPLPDGVRSKYGVREATVTVAIHPLLETRQIRTTNISFVNVPEGYLAQVVGNSLEVLVRAPRELVELIEGESVFVQVDLAAIGAAPGYHSVTPAIEIRDFPDAGIVGSSYHLVISLMELPEPPEGSEP